MAITSLTAQELAQVAALIEEGKVMRGPLPRGADSDVPLSCDELIRRRRSRIRPIG